MVVAALRRPWAIAEAAHVGREHAKSGGCNPGRDAVPCPGCVPKAVNEEDRVGRVARARVSAPLEQAMLESVRRHTELPRGGGLFRHRKAESTLTLRSWPTRSRSFPETVSGPR